VTQRFKELRLHLVDLNTWHEMTISCFCQIIIS
jgi:hypothetical protein